uniref:RING-type domain-containing protein n=1 Tax=Timema cristinae TaxID=61476 RepID=A0A7R9CNN5_TIMCR|nr:unnamed protein product [Timema cristinae]
MRASSLAHYYGCPVLPTSGLPRRTPPLARTPPSLFTSLLPHWIQETIPWLLVVSKPEATLVCVDCSRKCIYGQVGLYPFLRCDIVLHGAADLVPTAPRPPFTTTYPPLQGLASLRRTHRSKASLHYGCECPHKDPPRTLGLWVENNGLCAQDGTEPSVELGVLVHPIQREIDPAGAQGRIWRSLPHPPFPAPSSPSLLGVVIPPGCKIKALRAKTNTYIKTPVRGEEPVFVVTGRKEDVAKAKREILSAAEHFSQIRASRKNNMAAGGLGAVTGNPPGPPANVPGHVTIQVRVPYRVVGLVVGPKGATIKRIQQQTHTYIVTPSRDKEPVFEVTGMPESVEAARREIEAHIAVRTGVAALPENHRRGMLDDSPELLASLYKTGLGTLFSLLDTTANSANTATSGSSDLGGAPNGLTSYPTAASSSSGAFSSGSSSSSSSLSGSGQSGRLGDLVSIWSGSSLDRDEGLGDSPSFDTGTVTSSIWSFPSAPGTGVTTRPSPTASVSPTDSLTSLGSMVLGTGGLTGVGGRRDCLVCGEREVDAALVPCGHNLFCLDCATRMCDNPSSSSCPVCNLPVAQAIRIFS